jgi:hypothetical protein
MVMPFFGWKAPASVPHTAGKSVIVTVLSAALLLTGFFSALATASLHPAKGSTAMDICQSGW